MRRNVYIVYVLVIYNVNFSILIQKTVFCIIKCCCPVFFFYSIFYIFFFHVAFFLYLLDVNIEKVIPI